MIILNNDDGSHTLVLDDDRPFPPPVLKIPAGTSASAAWQQVLAFCAANGVRIIPQYVLINPSGTTGTLIS